ncbi:DNA polymerase III, delta subunit, partial [Chlamydia psittaci 06-1683]
MRFYCTAVHYPFF